MDKITAIALFVACAITLLAIRPRVPVTRWCARCAEYTIPISEWIRHQQNVGGWVPSIVETQTNLSNRCSQCGSGYKGENIGLN